MSVKPVILLVKLPMPLPSLVWLPLTVGLWLVLQQTPRAVTVVLPSLVTLPPHIADVVVILLTTAVVTVGNSKGGILSVNTSSISSSTICTCVTGSQMASVTIPTYVILSPVSKSPSATALGEAGTSVLALTSMRLSPPFPLFTSFATHLCDEVLTVRKATCVSASCIASWCLPAKRVSSLVTTGWPVMRTISMVTLSASANVSVAVELPTNGLGVTGERPLTAPSAVSIPCVRFNTSVVSG